MVPSKFHFLTLPQIQRLHARLITPNTLPTQPAMLDSATHSPMNLHHYAKQEDVFQLFANLAEKIMKNHAFQDGNKRTALVAADMFLKLNGYYLLPGRVDRGGDDKGMHVHGHMRNNNKDNKVEGLANAQVAVVTKQWSAEEPGEYYKSVAVKMGGE